MPWDFSYYSEKLKKERYEISDEMLKEALRKAIADENYELASKINEEVKRRGLDLNDASAPDDREE